MKHKHYDLIVAWANGAEIQWKGCVDSWNDCVAQPAWDKDTQYRIKPAPKPDSVKIRKLTYNADNDCVLIQSTSDARDANIMLVFDGETGALFDAQMLASTKE